VQVSEKRAAYAKAMTEGLGPAAEAVERAFASVPREAFLGPGPWKRFGLAGSEPTPDADPAHVYENALFELDGALGINNGEPRLWAATLASANIAKGETILHVGTGSGYYTAIMAELVGPTGRVIGAEIEPHLAERSRANLKPWPNAEALAVNGLEAQTPPLDLVIASAGLSTVPAVWLQRLKEGGRLVMPLTAEGDWPTPNGGVWHGGFGAMLVVRREGDRYAARFTQPVAFYPCIGARDPASEDALRQAFTTRKLADVKSLHLAPAEPDDSCWVQGAGWWLGTR